MYGVPQWVVVCKRDRGGVYHKGLWFEPLRGRFPQRRIAEWHRSGRGLGGGCGIFWRWDWSKTWPRVGIWIGTFFSLKPINHPNRKNRRPRIAVRVRDEGRGRQAFPSDGDPVPPRT
jgi:hypothetical protein